MEYTSNKIIELIDILNSELKQNIRISDDFDIEEEQKKCICLDLSNWNPNEKEILFTNLLNKIFNYYKFSKNKIFPNFAYKSILNSICKSEQYVYIYKPLIFELDKEINIIFDKKGLSEIFRLKNFRVNYSNTFTTFMAYDEVSAIEIFKNSYPESKTFTTIDLGFYSNSDDFEGFRF